MLQAFPVLSTDVEDHLYPNYYKFKLKVAEFFSRPDIISFRLGDKGVLKKLTDGEHAGQIFVSEGALFIKNSSVKRYYISERDEFYITEVKNELLPRSQIKPRDVLFTTIGKYLGVAALANQNLANANINQNVVLIRINEDFATQEYLSVYLNSKFARIQIDNLFTGNTHPILTYPKIKSIAIFLKDRSLEKLITSHIKEAQLLESQADMLIANAQKGFIKSLDIDFKKVSDDKSFILSNVELLNGEVLSPENYRPLYLKTIELIKQKHKWDYLGNIANFLNGDEVGSINYKLYLDASEDDLPFIRTTDLCNYSIDRFADFYIEKDVVDVINQSKYPNEILFTKDGKIGQLAIRTASDFAIIGSGILRIISKKVSPFYLFLALSIEQIGFYQARQRTVIASTMPHLREDRVADFVIPILDDQDELIEMVRKAFEFKEQAKVLINNCRKLVDDSLPLEVPISPNLA